MLDFIENWKAVKTRIEKVDRKNVFLSISVLDLLTFVYMKHNPPDIFMKGLYAAYPHEASLLQNGSARRP